METGTFLGVIDDLIDQLNLVHTSTNQRQHSTYKYIHAIEYLGSDEIPNHEGQRQHQHLHLITCHLAFSLPSM